MQKPSMFFLAIVACLTSVSTAAQSVDLRQYIGSVPKISVDEAIARALETSSLTQDGLPFHAVLAINQPGQDSSYQGSIEIYWAGPSKYRLAITSKSFRQVKIVNGGLVEEQDSGDFYPGWLRNYLRALMDPLPRANEFHGNRSPVMLGANVSRSCVNRDDRTNGITDMMTWAEVCFQGSEPRISSIIDFTYFMEFSNYKPFGKKLIARTYTIYTDDNDKVIGELTTLDPLSTGSDQLFTIDHPTSPDEQIDTRFVSSAANESLLEKAPTIEWPPVHEGKTDGYMIVHVITDRSGQVREAEKHNSDNPGMEDYGVEQAMKYKFKPLIVDGAAVQMETPLVLHFSTKIGDPIPVVTGAEIGKYASGCGYNPVLPKGLLPSGVTFKIRVSVNEQGKDTGEVFPNGIPWNVVQKAKLRPLSCHFTPYLVNGQPSYHHIDFVFTAP